MTINPQERLYVLYTYLADAHRVSWGHPEPPLRRTALQVREDLKHIYPPDSAGKKMLYRDLDRLRSAGIALDSDERVDGHCSYAVRTADAPPLDAATLTALTTVEAASVEGFASALAKLGGRIARSADGQAAIPAKVVAESKLVDDVICQLADALFYQRLITFTYHDRRLENVEPLALTLANGWVYLTAAVSGEAERVFRTDRIEGTVTLGRTFKARRQPAQRPPLLPWMFAETSSPAREALVVFDAVVARAAIARFPQAVIDAGPDGSVKLRISYKDPGRLIRAVLAFAERAEILEPLQLRHWIASQLQSYITSNAVVCS